MGEFNRQTTLLLGAAMKAREKRRAKEQVRIPSTVLHARHSNLKPGGIDVVLAGTSIYKAGPDGEYIGDTHTDSLVEFNVVAEYTDDEYMDL